MTSNTEITIKKTRVERRCEACRKFIEVGSPAIRWAGGDVGEFSTAYFHPECRAAEIALNRLHDTWHPYEWMNLLDAEREDYPWLRKEHRIAYTRLVSPHPKKETNIGTS